MSDSDLPGGGETILIVDDDPQVARALSRLLGAIGLRVLTVPEPKEAIALISDPKVRVDLIVLDIMLPGLSGFTVAEKVSSLRPGMRILYISGTAILPQEAPHPGLSGMVRFLAKPVEADVFLATVNELLTSRCEVGRRASYGE